MNDEEMSGEGMAQLGAGVGDGDEIVRMDVAEFREAGFLQEANRLFFHPHGLALEVMVEDDGSERLGGVWDYRCDEEGIVFGPGMIDGEKVDRVRRERERHRPHRERLFGTGPDHDSLYYVDVSDVQPEGGEA